MLGTSKLDSASSEAGPSKLPVTTQPILAKATEEKPEIGEDSKNSREPQPHKDETQVKLDTDRSFVTYPKGMNASSKGT